MFTFRSIGLYIRVNAAFFGILMKGLCSPSMNSPLRPLHGTAFLEGKGIQGGERGHR
jgi:hypothetical protein